MQIVSLQSMRAELTSHERTPPEDGERVRGAKRNRLQRASRVIFADERGAETVAFARVFTPSLHRGN